MYPNVFKCFSFSFRYYLYHPLRLIKHCTRSFKWAYQRIVRGYADIDVWSVNDWILDTLPYMLRQLAEEAHSYPVDAEPDEWHDKLIQMAKKLEMCTEEYEESQNEYFEKSFIDNKNCKEYFERSRELHEESIQRIKEFFAEFGECFYDLWD